MPIVHNHMRFLLLPKRFAVAREQHKGGGGDVGIIGEWYGEILHLERQPVASRQYRACIRCPYRGAPWEE